MNRTNNTFLLVCAVVPAILACRPTPPPAPELPVSAKVKSFRASPTAIEAGESTTLSWEVEDAASISLRRANGEVIPLPDSALENGTVEVKPGSSTVFLLSAFGESGSASAVASVVVGPRTERAPIFTAVPGEIRAGDKATLAWNAPDATQVELRDGSGQVLQTGGKNVGSLEVSPGFTASYTLRANGVETTTTVTVSPAVLAFASDVMEADAGGTINLGWRAGGAESLVLSSSDRGILTTLDDAQMIAEGSWSDVLPTSLPANGAIEYTLEAKSGTTSTISRLTVFVGADPVKIGFTAPGFVKPLVDFPVSWKIALADRVEIAVGPRVVYRATTAELAREGSVMVSGIDADATVELRASNLRGGSRSWSLPVSLVGTPVLDPSTGFTASTTTIAQGGQKVSLRWNVPNSRHVRVSVVNGGVLYEAGGVSVETGEVAVYPNKLTEYVLEADNTAGDSITSAPLAVSVTTPARLTYSPASAPAGAPVTVTGTTASNSGVIHGLPIIVKNEPGEGFVDIASTGVAYGLPPFDGDNDGMVFTLPEPFSTFIYGVPVTSNSISINTNGWFVFSRSAYYGSQTVSPFPSNALQPLAIAPLWVDLTDRNGEIYYRLDRVGAERRLIVQWNNYAHVSAYVPVPDSSITFQAQVYSSGKIVFAYERLRRLTNPVFSIGVVNPDERFAVHTTDLPAEGDTFTLFGAATPPVEIVGSSDVIPVRVEVDNGTGILELESQYPVLPPG